MAADFGATVAQTSEFSGFLSPQEAGPFYAEAEKTSIVQQVATKMPTGPTGTAFTSFTGSVAAGWVGETGKKPKTKGGLNRQVVTPKKIATIFVSSAETVRVNPGGYLQEMRSKVGEAIALAFDAAVMHGINTPFGNYIGQTTKAVSLHPENNTYDQLNAGLTLLVNAGYKWNGTLLDDTTEPIFNGAKDLNDRPLFIDAANEYVDTNSGFRRGRTLGRKTVVSDHVENGTTLGFMGDWRNVRWGQVGGLSYSVSNQTTLDLSEAQDGSGMTSLWEHNLIAVLVEAEFAVLVKDPEAFVRLTNVDPTP